MKIPAPPTLLLEPASFVAFQNGTLARRLGHRPNRRQREQHLRQRPRHPDHRAPSGRYEAALDTACPDTCTNVVVAATVDEIGTTLPVQGREHAAGAPRHELHRVHLGRLLARGGRRRRGCRVRRRQAHRRHADPGQRRVDEGGRFETSPGPGSRTPSSVGAWSMAQCATSTATPSLAPVAFSPDDTSPRRGPCPRIYTTETAPDSSDFVEPADYTAIFSELWKLSRERTPPRHRGIEQDVSGLRCPRPASTWRSRPGR